MILLSLDIGKRRTGIAYGDTSSDFVMALDTIHHKSTEELLEKVGKIIQERKPSEIIVGLPRLPQGQEGSQSTFVRSVIERLQSKILLPMTLVDERFSSYGSVSGSDPDAKAACEMLTLVLRQRNKDY